ncbi:uncharacterized protein N7500_006514 [Penicillium coprophilum]|uniref:uncharacterized protein n=1 Tax=Penicillium coprophilum TaxID=36646 RepID=UPI00239E55A3|nr:uncharacterized protein N7500_006514 [Penicillium coprophilum]KAJ5164684.1 hypothetical protein N7500_006514 [Penicillium coprophilum]
MFLAGRGKILHELANVMMMPLRVLSCLGFALDDLCSILVSAFAYAVTAGFCVLMIFWPRLCSITLAHHPVGFFSCEWTNSENLATS